MQFSAFPGPELCDWEGLFGHEKMLTKNIHVYDRNYLFFFSIVCIT